MADRFPGLETQPATVNDAHGTDDAARGAALMLGCAGPFLDTAGFLTALSPRHLTIHREAPQD